MAQRGMNTERERDGESRMDSRRVEKRTCNHYTNIVWEVRITFALLNPNTYHVVPDIPLFLLRTCCSPRPVQHSKATCSLLVGSTISVWPWCNTEWLDDHGRTNVFSTNTHKHPFHGAGTCQNGHSLLARWQKLSSETCSPRPSHRTTCIFFKTLMSTIQKSPIVHVPRIMNSRFSWPDQRDKAVLPISPACRVGFFIGGLV